MTLVATMCSAIYFVSRDSGDDIVQRNLFRDPGGDTVQRNLFANILNSPATPEVAVNQVALSGAQAARMPVSADTTCCKLSRDGSRE